MFILMLSGLKNLYVHFYCEEKTLPYFCTKSEIINFFVRLKTQDPKTLQLVNNEEESTQSPQLINIEIIKSGNKIIIRCIIFYNPSQIKEILFLPILFLNFLIYVHNSTYIIFYIFCSSSRFIKILYCLY